MPDDIDSLDYGAVREHVLAWLSALKQAQKQRAIAEEELAQWVHRVKLAENRGEPVLKRTAEQRVTEAREQAQRLRAEEQDLGRKADLLKARLQTLRLHSGLSADADALLAQLQVNEKRGP